MQMERERRINGGIGDYFNGGDRSLLMESSSSNHSSVSPLHASPLSSSSSLIGSPSGVAGGAGGYIVHQVSKFDTLAGVAIKYGVEVADIKRINGLVTDLQMFALNSLNIPLPGRHPPSPILSNGFESQGSSSCGHTPPNRRHSDLYDSLQSLKLKPSPQRKVSSAMTTLQGYYGLKTPEKKPVPDGFEMALFSKGDRDEQSHITSPPLSYPRKCRSIDNGLSENGDLGESLLGEESEETGSVRWFDKLRRRQKSEADFTARTPEKMMEESGGSCGFSATAGKGLALRPKAAAVTNRGGSGIEFESGFPTNVGDYVVVDNSGSVRKSSSTSSLQDTDNGSGSGSGSSMWTTSKWSLKPDLQALSTAAITRPIFDGLPKPITGRRNKTAVD